MINFTRNKIKLKVAIRHFFCVHDYRPVLVGRFPLVAAYCPRCSTFLFGNCVYYDGTTYQKKYKGDDAINFINGFLMDLKNRDKFLKDLSNEYPYDFFNSKEQEYRSNFESIERYQEIINELSKNK